MPLHDENDICRLEKWFMCTMANAASNTDDVEVKLGASIGTSDSLTLFSHESANRCMEHENFHFDHINQQSRSNSDEIHHIQLYLFIITNSTENRSKKNCKYWPGFKMLPPQFACRWKLLPSVRKIPICIIMVIYAILLCALYFERFIALDESWKSFYWIPNLEMWKILCTLYNFHFNCSYRRIVILERNWQLQDSGWLLLHKTWCHEIQ